MDSHREQEAIDELSKAIAFKSDLHLLHLRAAFHECIGDLKSALRDCRAALSIDPNHVETKDLYDRVYGRAAIKVLPFLGHTWFIFGIYIIGCNILL